MFSTSLESINNFLSELHLVLDCRLNSVRDRTLDDRLLIFNTNYSCRNFNKLTIKYQSCTKSKTSTRSNEEYGNVTTHYLLSLKVKYHIVSTAKLK